jgi:sialic acid synthase
MTQTNIIAEVGQNHQGSLELAIKYIEEFAKLGATTVKFQARHNTSLFHESRYNLIYDSPNSFGRTYGEHREFLEFDIEQLSVLKECAHQNNVLFCCTPFDIPSLEMLLKIDIDTLKVASFDLGNIPFLFQIAMTGKPIIMSTGGGSSGDIQLSVDVFNDTGDLSILHCTSEYPCPPEKVDLGMIPILKDLYPNHKVGISDHFNGTLTGPLAYLMGATVFEKHVTFDRSSKGTDHKFSLEPAGFKKFVRDIERAKLMLQDSFRPIRGSESVFTRLGKSCVASRNLDPGTILSYDDITGLIFDKQYIPIRQVTDLVGKRLNCSLPCGSPILPETLL